MFRQGKKVRLISLYQTVGKDGDLNGYTVAWRIHSCDSGLLHPHKDSRLRLGAYVNAGTASGSV